jgi:hypothetical protein
MLHMIGGMLTVTALNVHSDRIENLDLTLQAIDYIYCRRRIARLSQINRRDL